MRIRRSASWMLALGLLLTACSDRSDTSGTASPSVDLKATDTGVTATELRLAVIADVNTAVRPGLFQSAVDGVRAWASRVNANGGLAGRKVVVKFYDSQLNADQWRNSVLQACKNDFAMVGTTAVIDSDVTEMVDCGIPDLAQLTPSDRHGAAPNTFSVLIRQPQREVLGPEKWYLDRFKSEGAATAFGSTPPIHRRPSRRPRTSPEGNCRSGSPRHALSLYPPWRRISRPSPWRSKTVTPPMFEWAATTTRRSRYVVQRRFRALTP